jgi:MFS family permease
VGALVIPVFGIGVIASPTIMAGIPDRFGAARTLIGAVVLESAGLAGVAVATSPPETLLALAVMAVGQGLAVPSLGLLALASVPPSRHGRTAGAFFAYFDAGVGLGGPAGRTGRGYLSIPRAAEVHAAVTSRIHFACVVASEETHSTSLLPGPRSSELAIALSAFS